MKRKKIYLAGPDVFLPNAKEVGQMKKDLCEKYGFDGIFPIDVELDFTNLTPIQAGIKISEINETLIKSCDVVIANITPFRSPSADVGTVFEIGFAKALNKMIFAYSNTSIKLLDRTIRFFDIPKNEKNEYRDQYNMVVEQFEMVDNLMIDGGIFDRGGKIITVDVPEEEIYTSLIGFEKCLELLKSK
jgi:nucleoside 2-deoxyribosyltransferase